MSRIERICLYLFFFSMNFEVWDPFQTNGFFSIAKLTGIIYFLVSLPRFINSRTGKEYKSMLTYVWLFFGLMVLVNAFHVESIGDSFFDFTYFQNIILFWVLINHEQKEHMVLEKGMLYFALGSVVLALLYYNGIGVEYIEGRVTVFGDNQNIIGQRMCISMVILILAVMQNRLQLKKIRFLFLLPLPIMMALLVESGSRLAILSFVLVFVVGIILYKTRKHWWKVLVFIVGGLAIFLLWEYAMQSEVLRNRMLESLYEGNLSNRQLIWQNIIPIIKSNPLFGIGQSGYREFCQVTYGEYTSPHNVILEVLVFSGFAGLLIYFYFLFLVFKRSWLSYRREGLLLPVLLLMVAFSMIVISHILEVKLGWAIFAYAATSAVIRQEGEQEATERIIFE